MTTKHTPGPWQFATDRLEILDPYGYSVADVRCSGIADEAIDANARLIAAAPTMFEALQRIADGEVMAGEFTHIETVHMYQSIARAALTKARS